MAASPPSVHEDRVSGGLVYFTATQDGVLKCMDLKLAF